MVMLVGVHFIPIHGLVEVKFGSKSPVGDTTDHPVFNVGINKP
jgi:hypothetical protein